MGPQEIAGDSVQPRSGVGIPGPVLGALLERHDEHLGGDVRTLVGSYPAHHITTHQLVVPVEDRGKSIGIVPRSRNDLGVRLSLVAVQVDSIQLDWPPNSSSVPLGGLQLE